MECVCPFLKFKAEGKVASSDPTAPQDPYSGYGGLAGYYTDWATGLCLLGFRYYDVASGRFLTRDPIGFVGGINLYEYVGNYPLGRHDPRGLAPIILVRGPDRHWMPEPDPLDPVNKFIGNPYVNCGVGAVISALQGNYSDVGNVLESLCQVMAACGSGYVCAAANEVLGDISLEGPEVWLFTCLIGALCGAFSAAISDMCTGFNPCENSKSRLDWCDILYQAVAGCLGGICGVRCSAIGQFLGGLGGWGAGAFQSWICNKLHHLVGDEDG